MFSVPPQLSATSKRACVDHVTVYGSVPEQVLVIHVWLSVDHDAQATHLHDYVTQQRALKMTGILSYTNQQSNCFSVILF